mgnify:CR=1 FL=1
MWLVLLTPGAAASSTAGPSAAAEALPEPFLLGYLQHDEVRTTAGCGQRYDVMLLSTLYSM